MPRRPQPNTPHADRQAAQGRIDAATGGKGLSGPTQATGLTEQVLPLPQMPHERDQATGQVGHAPDPVIDQARRDLDAGQVDTDMRATAGLDAARRERLVGTPQAAQASATTARGTAADSLVGAGSQPPAAPADRPPKARR